ncbi:MAG: response regulator transcription factor [Saprospiraceae bacterium]|nr:response regulator transcription factor [Saprospiraceae bacterium]
MTKVFIYEDNKDRSEALISLINKQSDLKLVGHSSNCANVASEMKNLAPDIVLMDLNMPKVDGFVGLKRIKEEYPEIKVLLQTIIEDSDKILECIKAGAEGYILKNDSPQKLLQAIKDVMEGGANLTPSVAIKILRSLNQNQSKKAIAETLTERETEVLELLSLGKSYKMIAADMDISFNTVNSHLKKIYEKLRVNSAGEAIRMYYN